MQAQRSKQANRYAEVVRGVNKALVAGSQDQYDAVNAFLAACPEEENGQHLPTRHLHDSSINYTLLALLARLTVLPSLCMPCMSSVGVAVVAEPAKPLSLCTL